MKHCGDRCRGESTLRDLSLPVIRSAMWPLIALGMPQLTSLESLGAIQTGSEGAWPQEGACAYEFPVMRRFSCGLMWLATLQSLCMPTLQTLTVRMCVCLCVSWSERHTH